MEMLLMGVLEPAIVIAMVVPLVWKAVINMAVVVQALAATLPVDMMEAVGQLDSKENLNTGEDAEVGGHMHMYVDVGCIYTWKLEGICTYTWTLVAYARRLDMDVDGTDTSSSAIE